MTKPLILLLVAASLACQPRVAADSSLLRLVATDSAFQLPSQVPGGLVHVRLVNQGTDWHEALLVRLEDSASVTSYLAAARAGQDFPPGSIDLGGPAITAAGDSSEVLLSLQPGRYAFVCWTHNHVKAGMIAGFTVVQGASGSDSVTADGTVALQDYSFTPSAPLTAGSHLLEVINQGTKVHELALYRLETGRTLQDFAQWSARPQGPPPAQPAGGVASMVPGSKVHWRSQLTPGRYFMVCGVPEGAKIHAQLGMIYQFVVP